MFSKTFLFLTLININIINNIIYNVYTAKHINSHLPEVCASVTAYLCVHPYNQEDMFGTPELSGFCFWLSGIGNSHRLLVSQNYMALKKKRTQTYFLFFRVYGETVLRQ